MTTFSRTENTLRHVVVAAVLASTAAAQGAIPVRPLGPIVATATTTFANIAAVRQLSDGRVLVNDPTTRRVTLLDATLANPIIVLDSVGGKDNSYGTATSVLIDFTGDSTLFVDRIAQAFLVIAPNGTIARTTPIPGRSTYLYLTSPTIYGPPGLSPSLGLVYNMPVTERTPARPAPDAPDVSFISGDSSGIMAVNIETRVTDTLTRLWTGRGNRVTLSGSGTRTTTPVAASTLDFRTEDRWAMMSDGSIAVVRARDYRVEFINPDRTRTIGPRVPYDWRRITDEDKVRIADSLSRFQMQLDSVTLSRWIADSAALARGDTISSTSASLAAIRARLAATIARGSSLGIVPTDEMLAMAGGAGGRPLPRPRIPQADIPDYWPALEPLSGAARADADNRVWVRPKQATRSAGGPVYDVIDRKGELVDRVQLPPGKTLVGFGPNGVVYLASVDAGVRKLERAQFKSDQ